MIAVAIQLKSYLARLGLAICLLAAAGPWSASAAPSQPNVAPAWHDTGLAFAAEPANFCFDGSRPGEVIANIGANGPQAFSLERGAVDQASLGGQSFYACGPDGSVYVPDYKNSDTAWRFSLADPAGRPIDHFPTDFGADGSQQIYALDSAAPEYKSNAMLGPGGSGALWASADGGLTWAQRGQQFDGQIEDIAVAAADARALYALTAERDYSKPLGVERVPAVYTIYFSPDAGLSWEKRFWSQAPGDSAYAGPFFEIDRVPGYGSPVNTLQLIINPGKPGSGNYRTVLLSTDDGRSFQPLGQRGLGISTGLGYAGNTLILLKYTAGQADAQSLARSTDGGATWQALRTPPLDSTGVGGADLQVVQAAPASLCVAISGAFWYSPNLGQSWELYPLKADSPLTIAPYLPLTVVGAQDRRVYTLRLPTTGSELHDAVAASAAPGATYFPQTGHNLGGVFGQYWLANGGLAQQGYPISEPFSEISPTDGRLYRVQYFERAVFEYHPENQPPYNVLLSLLGSAAYKARYGAAGAPGQHPSTVNPRFFPQTGHSLDGQFRAYWEAHGGLAQQGYPISDEFQERNAADGKTYTVQYFQRAVFELHPENAATLYEVLLSQLGATRFKAVYPTQAPPQSRTAPLLGFGLVWQNTPDVAADLGCEQAPEAATPTTLEYFEHSSPLAALRFSHPQFQSLR